MRPREITTFQSGNETFDRWMRDVAGILNPFLRTLPGDVEAAAVAVPLAACTVAATGAVTNARNVASVTCGGAGTGEYVVALTANTATKYVPLATVRSSPFAANLTIGVQETTPLSWLVQVADAGTPTDTPFSFVLLAVD